MDRRAGAAAFGGGVLALVLLSGCGSDDAAPSAPSAAPSSSTVSSPEPSQDPTAAATATTTAPTYTQAPATGQLLDLTFVRLNAPAGWPADRTFAPDTMSIGLVSDDIRQSLTIATGGLSTNDTIDEFADSWMQTLGSTGDLQKVAPVTIAGRAWFHLAGARQSLDTEVFGLLYRGQMIVLTFDYDLSLPERRREQTTGSVLASLQLR